MTDDELCAGLEDSANPLFNVHSRSLLHEAAARIRELAAEVEALRVDLAKFDWEIICEGCGAPLFDGDDFVSDPDGIHGCWGSMTDLPSKRERPCFAYRVGKKDARALVGDG